MLCANCGAKMRCVFSVPLGPELRRRLHKCPHCKTYLETLELPVAAALGNRWSREELLEVIENSRRKLSVVLGAIKAKRAKRQ